MNLNTLKELGFSEGEIKVYSALIKLQRSTISKIIEYSGVSSSKVYLILDKLVNRGLVNYIVVNNIKEYHLANPENLLEYIRREKEKIIGAEKEGEKIVQEINLLRKEHQEESAHIYRGLAGVKTAHFHLLEELKRGEEYVFFSVEKEMLKQKAVQLMFKSVHLQRDEKGVTARGIALPEMRQLYHQTFKIRKEYQIRFHELTLNQGITIGKNRIIFENTYPDAFAVEIISPQMAKSYREFFNKVWKIAKP